MPWGAAAAGGIGSIVSGLIGGASSIAGASISASAAQNAAQTQANAAREAAQLQQQTAQQALQLQQNQFDTTNTNLAPYRAEGINALDTIQNYILGPNSSFLKNTVDILGPNPQVANLQNAPNLANYNLPSLSLPTYNMPQFTQQQFQQNPGYQYQLNQSRDAIQNSAAGRTGALSGNMLTGLQQNASGLANQDWQQAYQDYAQNYLNQYNAQNQNALSLYNAGNQNALNLYNAQNNQYLNNQNVLGNFYNQYSGAVNNQMSNIYNILASLAGSGQNAAARTGAFGQAGVNNASNILQNQGTALAQGQIGSANALAAGQVGTANAINTGINNFSTQLLSAPNNSNSNLSNALNYFFANNSGNNAGNYNLAMNLNNAPESGFGYPS